VVRASLARLIVAASVLAAVGCTQTKATADAAAPLPRPVEVRGKLGEPVSAMGVNLTVMSIDPYTQNPGGFPRLVVGVRSENSTDQMTRNPQAELRCDEANSGGDWYNGSTWESDGLLPPGNVNEGQLYLGFPAKEGTNGDYAVPTCSDAQIVMTVTKNADLSTEVVRYAVDPKVIQLAIGADIGPNLPLPNRALPANS
jgi:hypothetical protein